MEKKTIVLENTLGQTVRTFHNMPAKFEVVLRLDTGRVVGVKSFKELEEEGVPFKKLATVKSETLTYKGIDLKQYGTVKVVKEVKYFSESVKLKPESNRVYKSYLKVSALSHAVIVILILSLGFMFNPEKEVEPTEVVILKPRKKIQVVPPEPVQKVAQKKAKKRQKRVKKVVNSKKTTRKRNLVKRSKRKNRGNKVVSMKDRGALSVLGSLSKSKQKGGVNLNKVKTSFGAGMGGTGGSGGVQTSVYAKGLTAAPAGHGGKVHGAGGYGTKGKGGGRAGYGKMGLSGASGGYFKPLTQQALVGGGLDMAQVAAVISRHQGQIRYCYEKGLQSKPKLSGRIKMKFTINGRGIISAANVGSSSLKNRAVESCITKKLRSWKFPRPVGNKNVKVTYPFLFKRLNRG